MSNEIWDALAKHFDEEKVKQVVEALAAGWIFRLEQLKNFTVAELGDLNVPPGAATVLQLEAEKATTATVPLQGSRTAYFVSEAYDRLRSRCTIEEQMSDTKPPPLLNYRPDTAHGLPIALVSRVFAYFLDLCDHPALEVTPKDSAFVHELCFKSSQAYVDEGKRSQMLITLLRDYLPSGFLVDKVGNKDIAIFYLDQLLAIIVVRNEGLAGNAYMQASACYVDELSKNRDAIMVRCERFPVFLLEITGALLKVSGAAYTSSPLVEPLKMGLLVWRTNRKEMSYVFRIVVALRKSLLKLVSLRAGLLTHPSAELDLAVVDLPYPLQNLYSSGVGIKVLSPKLYLLEVMESSPIRAVVSLPAKFEQIRARGFSRILVKFCQRYGSEVHADWFSRGCAPELFETVHLPGDWIMVLMEYLHGYDDLERKAHRFGVTSREWKRISVLARKCLEDAQASTLLGVHGDLRLDNLMVDENLTRVLAVDFERAGIQGSDRYPFFMNHKDVEWPAGAVDNELLMQAHDRELLEAQLQQKPKRKYDWHSDKSFVPKKLAMLASGGAAAYQFGGATADEYGLVDELKNF